MKSKTIIKIKLIAFNPYKLNNAAVEIMMLVKSTGGEIAGPVPLPSKEKKFIVTCSPHVDKNAREKFAIRWHRRLFYISDYTPATMEALTKVSLPSGVEVEVKVEEKKTGSA